MVKLQQAIMLQKHAGQGNTVAPLGVRQFHNVIGSEGNVVFKACESVFALGNDTAILEHDYGGARLISGYREHIHDPLIENDLVY